MQVISAAMAAIAVRAVAALASQRQYIFLIIGQVGITGLLATGDRGVV